MDGPLLCKSESDMAKKKILGLNGIFTVLLYTVLSCIHTDSTFQ